MSQKNAFYAQSGGVTSVINATASAVIETARQHKKHMGKVYAGKNGILGALREELIDTSQESIQSIRALQHTPGGAFGSCRYKLQSPFEQKAEYQRLISVFKAHNIGYFFYNGGGDSQDTANKVTEFSREHHYPMTCIGIPKTVDNDLPYTDCSPGFGSVAKYIAISTLEASLDVVSMADTSTKVFILEVMGRHAGWIAAAGALAEQKEADLPPPIILFPEVAFQPDAFLKKVEQSVKKHRYCTVVVSEGLRDEKGAFLSESGLTDHFGHKQLGGVAPIIAQIIRERLGYKHHWAVSDYLQRSARHIASKIDLDHAYAVGQAAVEMAIAGKNAVMPIIERYSDQPYRWRIGEVALKKVANVEKKLPKSFITRDGFGITKKAYEYLLPLVQGEAYPPYKNGLPNYIRLKNQCVEKQLPDWKK